MFTCCAADTTSNDAPMDMCPLHPTLPIEKVCIENRCLQPLCQVCEVQHLDIHKMLSTEAKLMHSEIVKHYALQQCQRQIRQLSKLPPPLTHLSSKESLQTMVDQFFYGSTPNRLSILKQREQILLKQPAIGTVITYLLEEHQYIVPKNFESILALFLDKNLIFHNI